MRIVGRHKGLLLSFFGSSRTTHAMLPRRLTLIARDIKRRFLCSANHAVKFPMSSVQYSLPERSISILPQALRGASKLLAVDPSGQLADLNFRDIVDLLPANAHLLMNDSKVSHVYYDVYRVAWVMMHGYGLGTCPIPHTLTPPPSPTPSLIAVPRSRGLAHLLPPRSSRRA